MGWKAESAYECRDSGGLAPRPFLFHEGDNPCPCDARVAVFDVDASISGEKEFPADPLRRNVRSRAVSGNVDACGGSIEGSREGEGAVSRDGHIAGGGAGLEHEQSGAGAGGPAAQSDAAVAGNV